MDSRILGLVFENLNGFKEGSFYTPGFITEYMCKESLEKIILEKFNKLFSANAQDLQNARELLKLELKSGNTQAKAKLKEALLSIKVCDPSVGSGHFLASALNYLCYYFDYFTLVDLENINLSVENDTLKQGFHYKRPRDEKEQTHKNQQALFNLKKEIIESCLFGVDINPISCEIARLRLWIELLKNSYYTEFKSDPSIHKLETLPNIDINIKCGNSLISRFDLQEYDEHNKPKIHTLAWLTNNNTNFANNFKEQIKNYKQQVNLYKNALGNKKDIADKIEVIKTLFRNHLVMVSPIATELESNLCKFVQKYGDETFDIETPFGMEMIKIIRKKNQEQKGFRFQPTLENPNPSPIDKKANDLLQTIKKDYEALESLKEDSFEWRFAFPEVLDSNGDFLGFDLVIGNPPYIRQEEIKHLKPQLQKAFRIYKGTSDIYTYFYEQGHKILKHNGILSFITSNKYCRAGYGEPLREFLLEATALLYYIELNGIKVFDSASVDTSILSFIKTTPDSKHTFDFAHPKDYDTKANVPLQEYITPQSLLQSSLTKESFIFQDSTNAALKAKIEAIGTPLKEWDISINYGIKTGYNEAFIIDSAKRDEILRNCVSENERQRTSELIKPILRGRDIKRYSYEWAGLWIINTHNGYKDSNNNKIPPIDIADYPALKAHLDTHWDKIAKRTDKGETPYNLRNCAYLEEFEKEKIVYQTLARTGNAFQFDNSSYFVPNSCYIITSNKVNLKYLLGLLNSKMMLYYLDNIFSKLDNTGWQWILSSVEKLPIPQITESNKPLCDEIIKCVDKILEIKACHTEALAEVSKNTKSKKDISPTAQNDKADSTLDTSKLESKLDSLVYKLYNLTNDEIEIIKGNNER
ncbi:Eco57I restriction-modification methylase domain-containing protein [Helicobacter winghamensis]